MKRKLLLSFFIISLFNSLIAQIIHVPGDYLSIQEGINASSDGDTVLVAEDTYYENIKFMGKAITVASEYIIDEDSSHIINTIIDGSQALNPDSSSTVMFVHGEDTTSIIAGFTIQGGGGLVNTDITQVKLGGGIAVYDAGAKIVNNKIINNMVTHTSYRCGGAGIGNFINTNDNWIVISDNIISNNSSIANSQSAFGGGLYTMNNAIIRNNIIEYNNCYNDGSMADGGGIEVEQGPSVDNIIYIDNNTINNNTIEGENYGYGAGIASLGVSNIHITNNNIANNSSSGKVQGIGGGIYIANCVNMIKIFGNNIENNICNSANYTRGGGFCILQPGKTIISENQIINNLLVTDNSAGGGGGFFHSIFDTISINKNYIAGNTIGENSFGFGGGICLFDGTNGVLLFNNNILTNNYSSYDGGGLWTYNASRVGISNCIFKNNEAGNSGGGLRFRQNLSKEENLISSLGVTEIDADNASKNRDDIFHPVISNSNFISNNSDRGGAIESDHIIETPIIFNSIFWENEATLGRDIYNYSSINMYLYNNNLNTSMVGTPWEGENNINENPEFIDDSCHIDWTSHCANAGVDSLEVYDIWYQSPTTDIDGDVRPYDWTLPDIGVDEAPIHYVDIDEFFIRESKIEVLCFPNPFSTSTTLSYVLQQPTTVQLSIYNQLGQLVYQHIEDQQKGEQQLIWNAEGCAEGVYFYRFQSGEAVANGKLIKAN